MLSSVSSLCYTYCEKKTVTGRVSGAVDQLQHGGRRAGGVDKRVFIASSGDNGTLCEDSGPVSILISPDTSLNPTLNFL